MKWSDVFLFLFWWFAYRPIAELYEAFCRIALGDELEPKMK